MLQVCSQLLRKSNQGRERGTAGMRGGGRDGGGLSCNHLVREGLVEGRPRLRVGRDGWPWGRATRLISVSQKKIPRLWEVQ